MYFYILPWNRISKNVLKHSSFFIEIDLTKCILPSWYDGFNFENMFILNNSSSLVWTRSDWQTDYYYLERRVVVTHWISWSLSVVQLVRRSPQTTWEYCFPSLRRETFLFISSPGDPEYWLVIDSGERCGELSHHQVGILQYHAYQLVTLWQCHVWQPNLNIKWQEDWIL